MFDSGGVAGIVFYVASAPSLYKSEAKVYIRSDRNSVAVDPTGKFAYTTHEILIESPTVNVSTYTIDSATGVLTRVGAEAGIGSNPASITVEPSGRFAYVANQASYNVSIHTINATNGALNWNGFVNGSAAAGVNPSSVAVDPAGRFAYVANNGSSSVSAYSINASTGALTDRPEWRPCRHSHDNRPQSRFCYGRSLGQFRLRDCWSTCATSR